LEEEEAVEGLPTLEEEEVEVEAGIHLMEEEVGVGELY
jgi:hypothetical protein